MAEKAVCQECHCVCKTCATRSQGDVNNENVKSSDTLHLFQEIENLNQQLVEREYYILNVETSMLKHAEQFPNGEWEHLQQELFHWKDKYSRLLESHKKLQKVNQGLEDKLLKLVDKFESEKGSLTKDIAELTTRLVEARFSIDNLEVQNVANVSSTFKMLTTIRCNLVTVEGTKFSIYYRVPSTLHTEGERDQLHMEEQYRNDCNIAIQLLQCKPSNFIAHKLSSFPSDLQEKVRLHFSHQPRKELSNSRSSPELRTIRVPIPTFPPTAMVYSVNNGVPSPASDSDSSKNGTSDPPDYVSAAIMAKVLEERAKERIGKIEPCRVCWYRRHSGERKDQSTQTRPSLQSLSCLGCSNIPIVPVHTRHRNESTSSTESHLHQARNGSFSSTETAI